MDSKISCSINFKDIQFPHVHIHDDAQVGEHSHRVNIKLVFNARSGYTALPATNSVIMALRDRVEELAGVVKKENFEKSAHDILENINEWIPDLKERCELTSDFYLANVRIKVISKYTQPVDGVLHPDIESIIFSAELET